jgi:hypothetical protein
MWSLIVVFAVCYTIPGCAVFDLLVSVVAVTVVLLVYHLVKKLLFSFIMCSANHLTQFTFLCVLVDCILFPITYITTIP